MVIYYYILLLLLLYIYIYIWDEHTIYVNFPINNY